MDDIETKAALDVKSKSNINLTNNNTSNLDTLTSPYVLKNQSSSSSNSKSKTNTNNIQRRKSIQRRQRGTKQLINQEKNVSNLDTSYIDSNESEEDILVHSKVYAATLTKETKKELAKRARELKQQQAIAKKISIVK
jgi:acetoin utilization deacetylase AcuC-like enzyme